MARGGKCRVKMIKVTDAFSCCKVVELLPSMLTFLIVLSENLNYVSFFFFLVQRCISPSRI